MNTPRFSPPCADSSTWNGADFEGGSSMLHNVQGNVRKVGVAKNDRLEASAPDCFSRPAARAAMRRPISPPTFSGYSGVPRTLERRVAAGTQYQP